MKKYWKVLSSVTLAAMLMAACGTANQVDNNNGNGGTEQPGSETPADDQKDIAYEEVLSPSIELKDGKYLFTLTNTSDENVDLSFSSTQEYEYMIYDKDGNHLYTYSMDKMFGEMFVEKTLAPGEEYVMEVDVAYFSNLEKGTYKLEIWSSALESDQLRAEMEFSIDEKAIIDAEGSYVGQIDNNSIEIIDSNGDPKAYRLTDETRLAISTLEKDQKVKFSYYEQAGQLVLESIEGIE